MSSPDEGSDPEDRVFLQRFEGLRGVVFRAAEGITDRIRDRVDAADQAPRPRLLDTVIGGVVEMFNAVTRLLRGDRSDDDDR